MAPRRLPKTKDPELELELEDEDEVEEEGVSGRGVRGGEGGSPR